MINISVAYATVAKQLEINLSVEESCTVAMAIRRSKILEHFPEIHFSKIRVGINSKKAALDAILQEGDRVEIYRPLLLDPKAARILRAKQNN